MVAAHTFVEVSVTASGSAAEQIARAMGLRESGTISLVEFDRLNGELAA